MSTVLGEIETVRGCSSASIVLVVVLVLESPWAGRLEWSRFGGQASTVFVPAGTE